MRGVILGALVLVACGITISMAARGAPTPPAVAAAGWEYKVIVEPKYPDDYEKEFNKLGEQGWEHCDSRVVAIWAEEAGRDVKVVIFKRPKR